MLLFFLFAALAPQATPPEALAPLLGHCWQGAAPGGGTDTHCFEAHGGIVRDHHDVLVKGKPAYSGDTVYMADPNDGTIRFTYSTKDGILDGVVTASPEGLDFAEALFIRRDGKPGPTLSSVWRWAGDAAYDVTDGLSGEPRRYTRID